MRRVAITVSIVFRTVTPNARSLRKCVAADMAMSTPPRLTLRSKEVDPNAGVDDDHLSRLIASRSPVHLTFPFRRRISPCRPNCSSVRSPSSTASRFVRAPEALKASAISLSSMTMLVLMGKRLQMIHITPRRTKYLEHEHCVAWSGRPSKLRSCA